MDGWVEVGRSRREERGRAAAEVMLPEGMLPGRRMGICIKIVVSLGGEGLPEE